MLACISVAKKLEFYRGQDCFHELERPLYIDTAAFSHFKFLERKR